ncbi:MAG TPA: hypothetical protein VGE76_16890 [Opitutaceae bacterium]
MQLSPSTVPSDSTLLAGFIPAGVSAVASEGVGLAEPAGFAELMAVIAPAPAGATTDVGQPLLRSTAVTPANGGATVIDMRTPGLVADIATPVVESLDDVDGSVAAEESGAAMEGVITRPHSRSTESAEDEPDGEESNFPRVGKPRRSLHEPVAGLETMIVPQMVMAPAPVAEEELALEEQPAELDTEEAPLDEDDSTGEETLTEVSDTGARAGADVPVASFPEIAPTPEISRASHRGSYVTEQPPQTLSTVSAANPMSRGPLTAVASRNDRGEAPATFDGVERPHADAKPGRGIATTVSSGETRDVAAVAARPLPTGPRSEPVAVSSATREVFNRPLGETSAEVSTAAVAAAAASPIANETTAPAARAYGSTAQAPAPEVVARIAMAPRPLPPAKSVAVEPRTSTDAVSYQGEGDVSQVLNASSGFTAAVLPAQREVAPRTAAPRVAAAYATREKFAVQRSAVAGEHVSAESSQKFNFLNADSERLTELRDNLGIDVANSVAVMPELSSPVAFSPAAPVALSVHDVASTPVLETPETSAPEAVSTAEQAVEVVLRAVDTAADREQKVVKLEFSVGDADLSVRVELAHDEVRTVFRTESPELRAALAQEWQAVSADSGEQGGVRLAPAVISDKEQAPSTSADANSQRHERQAARQEDASSTAHQAAARSLLRQSASSPEATTAALPAFRPLAPLGTAQRLHLFA